jgi:hypothetical protein
MPIGRIRTTDSPIGIIRITDSPIGRISVSARDTFISETLINAGTPIGLLLALTYASQISVVTANPVEADISVRIRNTD